MSYKRFSNGRAWVKAGCPENGIVTCLVDAKVVKNADAGADGAAEGTTSGGTLSFTLTTKSQDRDTDTLDPEGADISHFQKNPVALWAHNQGDLPIGRWTDVKNVEGSITGNLERIPEKYKDGFGPAAANAYAVGEMVEDGFLQAVSIGFLPKEYTFSEDEDRPWGVDFKSYELLEVSVVTVPSNRDALGGPEKTPDAVDQKNAETSPSVEDAVRLALEPYQAQLAEVVKALAKTREELDALRDTEPEVKDAPQDGEDLDPYDYLEGLLPDNDEASE